MSRKITLAQAKARYVHRFTVEHIPAWALQARVDGTFYAPQFASDQEWYDNTLFPGEGHVKPREKHCFTTGQTWPLGQALAVPFSTIRSMRQAELASYRHG
jgi:hypothetical protein